MTRKLLAIFAHPDDETFGTGGTLAHYAKQGVQVHLICGTQGEVGEAPPDLKGFASVGEMRLDELMCASDILGLSRVHFLGYRDSGMQGSPDNQHPRALAAQPVAEVARQIAHHMRAIRPQVVITFDPIGGYRHPDHIAIQRATVEAIRLVSDPSQTPSELTFAPQKLYFSTFPRGWLRIAIRVMRLVGRDPRRFGRNKDIDIASIAEVDFPIHAVISTRDVTDIKQRAFACHASQGGGTMSAPMRWLQHLFASDEMFMRAIPADPPAKTERDLFEGVRDS